MAVVSAPQGGGVVIGSAQTGNGDTTDTIDRGSDRGPAAIAITTTVGATPTVTVSLQGSIDGTNFWNVPYATTAAASTVVVANPAAITTATTTTYLLQANHPWRFLKVVRSANTNVTLTTTFYA